MLEALYFLHVANRVSRTDALDMGGDCIIENPSHQG